MKIEPSYFKENEVVFIAKNLIGKSLFTLIDGQIAGGIITETEAYNGIYDKACHSYGGKRTARNEIMYAEGGCLYIYLCYGIHHLLNIVTNKAEIPDAILIRSIFPTHGEELILKRRNKCKITSNITQGPGKVSQALGVTLLHNGVSLASDMVWLEDRNLTIPSEQIWITPRIGIDYAGDDALLPYRFLLNPNFKFPI
ncbi:MAG: DNA-3-methyladenine glycosylase [Bacteroidales bacterium]